MEHSAGGRQVVSAFFDRVFEDVDLADFEVGHVEVSDATQVEVAGNDVTAGRDATGQPLRYRSNATPNLKAAPPWLKAELLNVPAVERVEQLRH
jgi:hypothetical protein